MDSQIDREWIAAWIVNAYVRESLQAGAIEDCFSGLEPYTRVSARFPHYFENLSYGLRNGFAYVCALLLYIHRHCSPLSPKSV